ncbi:MAG: hypothetical protein R2716_13715 [Microthrixaceae bacterium]
MAEALEAFSRKVLAPSIERRLGILGQVRSGSADEEELPRRPEGMLSNQDDAHLPADEYCARPASSCSPERTRRRPRSCEPSTPCSTWMRT